MPAPVFSRSSFTCAAVTANCLDLECDRSANGSPTHVDPVVALLCPASPRRRRRTSGGRGRGRVHRAGDLLLRARTFVALTAQTLLVLLAPLGDRVGDRRAE